jgi:purine-binding chemotaxis protein CheW
MSSSQQFCTFYLDELLFGIESRLIQEVVRSLELTEVPLAPETVSGLMNLRGQIVLAIDLRRRLELPPRPDGAAPMSVVVHSSEGAVGLLVDDIGDVIEVDEETFEPSPETLPERLRSVILGVHKLDRRLMHVLATAQICAADTAN